jgi:hypothetical protein
LHVENLGKSYGATTPGLLPEEHADPDNAGIWREPTLPNHEEVTREQPTPALEFAFVEDTRDEDLLGAGNLIEFGVRCEQSRSSDFVKTGGEYGI